MILIYSDFGVNGPYSGAMQAAVLRAGATCPVIDLMIDAPDRDPRAAAYLLAALICEFRPGDVGLCVVDPGVGSARNGLIVECDGITLVGPDNGLFELVIRRARQCTIRVIEWQPEKLSASFHGRDIFGPVAAMLAMGQTVPSREIAPADRFDAAQSWPDDLAEVVYIDGYGNLMIGWRADMGPASARGYARIGDHDVPMARTFADMAPGQGFWYVNSIGLMEIAVNCGRADRQFNAAIGTCIHV